MKHLKFLILLVLFIMTTLNAVDLDRIVAKVGREIILESELQMRIAQLKSMGIEDSKLDETEILNNMIETRLVIQKAKEESFNIDELSILKKVDGQLEEIKARFRSEAEFKQELKNAGMTVSDLKETISENIREEELKQRIISQSISRKVHITEAEIEEYYLENINTIPLRPEKDKIGFIMREVKVGKATKDKKYKEIHDILDRIRKGESFDELAETQSECLSGKKGGDLDFVSRGATVKPFEDAAFALMEGEVSEIVETQFGYHIIKVNEKKDGEIKVQHILKKLEKSENDFKAEKILMNNLLRQLRDGGDFAELAAKFSEDDSTAVKGGVMGEFSKDEYPELFKERLNKLDYGEYSEVVNEGDIFYILKKIEKIPERKYKFNELEEQLRNAVTSKKQEELYRELIEDLKNEKFIEVLL